MGIELMTSSLPRMRSTPELQKHRLLPPFAAPREVVNPPKPAVLADK